MSGSAEEHAPKSPSYADTWANCDGALELEQKNLDKVLAFELSRNFPELILYMRREVPMEEWYDKEKRWVPIVEQLLRSEKDISDLNRKQIEGILSISGSRASREGTRAHDFAEQILLGKRKLDSIPEEFQPGVKMYVDECQRLIDKYCDEFPVVEMRVPLFYSKRHKGTLDFGLATPRILFIRDLKYGTGKFVHVEENRQLGTYALSYVEYLESEDLFQFSPDTIIDIGIVQPRHREGKPVRSIRMTLRELRKLTKPLQKASNRIDKGSRKLNPSEVACYWCKARSFCEERFDAALEPLPGLSRKEKLKAVQALPDLSARGAKKTFDEQPLEDRLEAHGVAKLKNKELVALWSGATRYAKMADDIYDYLMGQALLKKKAAKGTKLAKASGGHASWNDEVKLNKLLKAHGLEHEQIYSSKVISPNQAKTALGDKLKKSKDEYDPELEKLLEKLIFTPEAKTVLVLESDSKQAVDAPVNLLPDLTGDKTPNLEN